jgi:acetylornithine deacetylase/succinyl-diaminopimelate desuccinylase-like protein
MGLMDPYAADRVLKQIDQEELVDLGKSLVRIPSFIGEETPLARWVASYLPVKLEELENIHFIDAHPTEFILVPAIVLPLSKALWRDRS